MRKIAWSALILSIGVLLGTAIQSSFAADIDCCALLQQRVDMLEKRLALLESVIKVSGGSVTIQGITITIKASGELTLKGAKINQN